MVADGGGGWLLVVAVGGVGCGGGWFWLVLVVSPISTTEAKNALPCE